MDTLSNYTTKKKYEVNTNNAQLDLPYKENNFRSQTPVLGNRKISDNPAFY